jgi:hypothetical protein
MPRSTGRTCSNTSFLRVRVIAGDCHGTISGMRSRLAAAALLIATLGSTLACTIAKERPARNFAETTGGEGMERMFWSDIKAANWVEVERMLASNYAGVTPAGIIDRTAALDQFRQMKLNDFSIGDLRTELNTSTFVVTYTITMNGTAGSHTLPSGPQHMMTVWQQQKKGWVMIAHSVTQPNSM